MILKSFFDFIKAKNITRTQIALELKKVNRRRINDKILEKAENFQLLKSIFKTAFSIHLSR